MEEEDLIRLGYYLGLQQAALLAARSSNNVVAFTEGRRRILARRQCVILAQGAGYRLIPIARFRGDTGLAKAELNSLNNL